MSQDLSAKIYRNLFTDDQWDAIDSALSDYADYGDSEAQLADEIKAKIFTIFDLTVWLKWKKILMSKISLKWDMMRPIVILLQQSVWLRLFPILYTGGHTKLKKNMMLLLLTFSMDSNGTKKVSDLQISV